MDALIRFRESLAKYGSFRYPHEGTVNAMIQSYQFGQMKISGKVYRQDLKIIQGEVIAKWWRRRGHNLEKEDMADIIAAAPQIVIVGTGAYQGLRVSQKLVEDLAVRGIRLIIKPTAEAVTEFNRQDARTSNLAGAFHLTC